MSLEILLLSENGKKNVLFETTMFTGIEPVTQGRGTYLSETLPGKPKTPINRTVEGESDTKKGTTRLIFSRNK